LLGVTGLAATRDALWVGTQALGVFRSTDGGATWKPVNEGLPLPSIESLVADPADPARLFVTIPRNGIYMLAPP
jgi:ligand-binding sensor domain-containing protein